MTVPELAPCLECNGARVVKVGPHLFPCETCCCVDCGEPSIGPGMLCDRHEAEDEARAEAAYKRRLDV